MLAGLLGLCGLSALAGAYLVHDGIAREWIRTSVAKVTHAGNYARSFTGGAALDTLKIDMHPSEMQIVRDARNVALGRGILLRDEQQWVPAMLTGEQRVFPAEMRLKGLMQDHRSTHKWSYRVRMPNDHSYLGMTAFSIQHPGTRGFLDEWLYRESVRAEGLLAPRYEFAHVRFNGSHLGLFAVEEHVTSQTWLPWQQRHDGVILRLDDTEMWEHRLALGVRGTVYAGGFANNMLHDFRSGRNNRDPVIRDQRDAAMRLLREFTAGTMEGSEVFDVDQMARFLALHELWSCNHVLGPPNARFYYNAITGKLEPVAGDVLPEFERGPFLVSFPTYAREPRDKVNAVFWPQLFLRDPVAMKAYMRELTRVSQPEYLQRLRDEVWEQETDLLTTMWREYPQVQRRWDDLARRQEQLRSMLLVSRTVLAYGQSDNDGIHISIANQLGLPVEVLAVQVDDRPLQSPRSLMADRSDHLVDVEGDGIVLARHRFDELSSYTSLTIPHDPYHSHHTEGEQPRIRVYSRLFGTDRTVINEARMGPRMLHGSTDRVRRPTIEEALEQFPFLNLAHDGQIYVQRGTWRVDEDLILPERTVLHAGPGVVLQFDDDAMLLVDGVHFEGDEESPVTLEPAGDSWQGMAVLRGHASTLHHVVIRGTRGINRDGWTLPGGVTFYECPVVIIASRFTDSEAPSALVMVHSDFTVRDCEFLACQRGALESTFSEGTVIESRFVDIAASAIASVGSRLSMHGINAVRVGDAIVARDDSHIEVDRLTVQHASVAVASIDLSFILADRLELADCEVGLTAYSKRYTAGVTAISAPRVTMKNVRHAQLAQTGAWIKANGQEYTGKPLDPRDVIEGDGVPARAEALFGRHMQSRTSQ